MPKVVVANIDPRIDGDYELVPIDEWTHDEWHKVKKLTGLKVHDFVAANEEGEADADVLLALGYIACLRAGRSSPQTFLIQGKLGDIDVQLDDDEAAAAEAEELAEADDAGPPAPPSAGSDSSNGAATSADGDSTNPSSGLLETDQATIGVPI